MLRAISLGCLIAVGASAAAVAQLAEGDRAEFETATTAFTACLRASVQMGMTTKMDPAKFKEGFAKSCMEQEERFRRIAVKVAMASGRSETAAAAEIDGNIANGRRAFAADQESYIKTGKVPR